MGAYFSFLRRAGEHLDPKTKAIISVITKVAAQTDAGFRQYLGRALAAGASAGEILDALLLAFPVLGLTKVTWAVDRLLEMNLPEFQPERLLRKSVWHKVCRVDELGDGAVQRFERHGRALFVRRSGADIAVFDSRCPHQATDIPAEALDGILLTCPKHGWTFDLQDGACVARGLRPLRRFEHKMEGGVLYAFW